MTKRSYIIILAFLLIFSAVLAVGSTTMLPTANAAVLTSDKNFDETEIEDDLGGIDLAAYPANPLGRLAVFEFIEYCYSDNAFRQGNYGIYIYLYNPQQINFSAKAGASTVNIATEYNEAGEPSGYSNLQLSFLDKTDDGVFYKFKVSNPIRLLENATAHSKEYGNRRYDVAGIQLRELGQATSTDYGIGGSYVFTGYAAGYGSDTSAESTLDCEISEIETVTLDVHDTFFRPEGSVPEDVFVRDQLTSVYFAVPNSIKEKYERLYQVRAEWYKAETDKIFVTDHKTMYDAIYPYLGRPDSAGSGYGFGAQGIDYPVYYNDFRTEIHDIFEGPITRLNYMFYVEPGETADDYIVSAEELEEFILKRSENCENKFLDKYDPELFESLDTEKTVVDITADTEYNLIGRVIGQSWWDELFCRYDTDTYNGIEAIHEVTEEDFMYGSDDVMDIELTCERLYIDKYDFTEFAAFYAASIAADKTVYLLRFDKTQYISVDVNLWYRAQDTFGNYYNGSIPDKNGYVAQRLPVYLDFDVISLTFEKDGVYTVIPAVSDPIDIFSDVTPPPNWNPTQGGCNGLSFWDLLMIILAVLAFVMLLPLLPTILTFLVNVIVFIFKGIFFILSLPFKAGKAIAKKIKERKAAKAGPPKPKTKAKAKPKTEPKPKITSKPKRRTAAKVKYPKYKVKGYRGKYGKK